jgi:cysteine desulfurase/selenocysteine lyase
MNLSDIREQFPGIKDKVFLDAACCSLAPKRAVAAIERFLDLAMTCPLDSSTHHHIFMDEMRAQARPWAARLINAQEDEIALIESTSHGLSLAASAIPLARGDRVLISDLEFLEVALPWLQKQQREGVHLEVVPNCRGELRVEDFEARITAETRVIAVSSVEWTNGFRLDMGAFSQLCRERGLWLVVDAIQQLGAIPFDVEETPIDILVCGGHKWLNAPFGCGFMYLSRQAMPRLKPPLAGYLDLKVPPGGWGNYFHNPLMTPVRDYDFLGTAQRFETGGTGNYPGAAGLAASLHLLHDVGGEAIRRHILRLTEQLLAGLEPLPVKIVTPRAEKNRSGIVTFSIGSAEQNVALMKRLEQKRILVSVRYTSGVGGVRVSCHFYNSEEDIARLLASMTF